MEKLIITYSYYGIEDDRHEAVIPFEFSSKDEVVELFVRFMCRRGYCLSFGGHEFEYSDLKDGYEILTLDEWFKENKLVFKTK